MFKPKFLPTYPNNLKRELLLLPRICFYFDGKVCPSAQSNLVKVASWGRVFKTWMVSCHWAVAI